MASKLAGRIEQARIDNGWDYRTLGRVLGVTHSTAWEWAHGKHEPNLASLRRIAKRLKISIADLLA
jgi:transcriptional regulator with XRE-family HTH domain